MELIAKYYCPIVTFVSIKALFSLEIEASAFGLEAISSSRWYCT